jgi:hypothetical protein
MHRSGTSAITRSISFLGITLGRWSDLWLELPGNPTGYWESSSLTQFNERLLRSVGSAWWCPPRLRDILSLTAEEGLRNEGAHLFRSVHSVQPWIWKDPRICVTLPFWRQAIPDHPVAVLVLRNPLEIAASLQSRDGLPVRWTLAVWERYLRHALWSLDGLPVLVTEYSALLADPERWCAGARDFLQEQGLPLQGAGTQLVERFVRSDLRHSGYSDEDVAEAPNVMREQGSLWTSVRRLVGPWSRFQRPSLPRESTLTDCLFNAARARAALDRLPSAAESMNILLAAEEAVGGHLH